MLLLEMADEQSSGRPIQEEAGAPQIEAHARQGSEHDDLASGMQRLGIRSRCNISIQGNFQSQGGHSAQMRTGRGSVQEIFRQPKIWLQLHCSPKISAHTLRKLYMNIL